MLPSIYNPSEILTLGILGGGQLAKMTAQAAQRMGLRVAIIEHASNSPAGMLTKLEFTGGWDSEESVQQFIEASDVITLENEFIPPEVLEKFAEKRLLYPTVETMRLVRDKFTQKQTFAGIGIPTPHFAKIIDREDLIAFGKQYGYPFVVKTRTHGYDGHGNATVNRESEIDIAWNRFMGGGKPRALYAESFVTAAKELAVMVARNKRGETAVYPCVQTIQQGHICVTVLAPAPIEEHLQKQAQEIALACVEAVGGIGVFGVEMFLTPDDKIIFNEIAPRPHNSGHYTIEACHVSQYENHVRAVLNLPLGAGTMQVPAAAMINMLGERNGNGIPDNILDVLKIDDVVLHLYGKKEVRMGRKMGHLTVTANTVDEAFARASKALDRLVW
ncbi:MAG: 5-(carboxyamino)imidazole ribonucleotide synthase [Chlorobi bacterium]|nr:MAG: 5-(carboxyamino)imidazole ribonucleotide synthase [Bacteroidota bacterium]KXK34337.1 MAG: 5-(carboxyamino)imidazole ribonucleotide synthase [Chlorobi bacterium OLB6]MBL1160160.1 5-(carboxyamino)imidazole ribonucleotide synthase [Chlorobiota bacterium]MBW7853297.1 5-(carboxyamino)imidazole ribonucleotide synthase [Candidatus Kapabacteria bacterium]MCC6332193.1 5-(carboxyamino)imidazole ribonucleotide synthase [Ignavibacteria bacterium]